jgi:type I restriction enzyme, R subunit
MTQGLHLGDKFLIPFFREGLGYRKVKANTVTNSLITGNNKEA